MLILSLIGFLMTSEAVRARTLGELLKALGNSIAHPQNQKKPPPAPRRTDHQDGSKPSASATASPMASATATPALVMVRTALAAPPTRGAKRDVPYGIPVADKPGFVTSPFAPNEGLVDVRSFPSGTEVKDPYTGKIFLTP
jgi:beta-lactamase class A